MNLGPNLVVSSVLSQYCYTNLIPTALLKYVWSKKILTANSDEDNSEGQEHSEKEDTLDVVLYNEKLIFFELNQ